MHAKTLQLLEGANYAALTFLLPSGTPSTHMMWVGTDADHVLINTEVHRFKFRNLSVGAKATVMVFEGPFSWAEVRGTVVEHVTGAAARAHIDELAQVYTGKPYANEVASERVVVKIRPDYDMAFPPSAD
jgi:Pyridoxamine 5'-phosphate oxidase